MQSDSPNEALTVKETASILKLEHRKVGAKRYTTEGAIERFLDELNKSDDDRLAEEGC